MPYESYVNKVQARACPICGKQRPMDWYPSEARCACWKCRQLKEKAVKGDEILGWK